MIEDNFKPRTYWDTFKGSYQMGKQKHRVYLLNLFKEKGITSLFDVGCGTGPIYQIVKEDKYPFVYKGTDYSPAMIKVCKEMFPEGEFEVQDARHLTESDNSWDCVLLMHSLDHLDDYQAAIKEAMRVSTKYVCIVLWRSFVADGTRLNDRNMMDKKPGEKPWEDTFLHEYSKQALEEEFKKNNLVIEHTAEGDAINSDKSHYNFLYLLRKL